jgi:hypothetical protein
MASNVRVEVDEQGIREFLAENKEIRDLMVSTGQAVAAHAQATAGDAENGPGGTIDGYASAGFTVSWNGSGGRRPRVEVSTNAPMETFMRVFFHTLKTKGVDHLRNALYSVTSRGGKW